MPSVRRNAVAFLTNRRADFTIDRISAPLVAAPPPTSTVQRSGRALRLFTKFWNIASFGASWPFTHCRLRVPVSYEQPMTGALSNPELA